MRKANAELVISWTTLWRILFFGLLATLLFKGRNILLALSLAIVISSGVETAVNFLERRRVPRVVGVILVFLLAVLGVVITLYAVLPVVVIDLNTVLGKLNDAAALLPFGAAAFFPAAESANEFLRGISEKFFGGGSSPLGAFSDVVGGLALGVSVVVISFYLSLSRNGVERLITALFPADYEMEALRIYERSSRRIGIWFRTQILLSFMMGFLMFLALLLIGVPHALLVGLFTAMFEIVPFVGPIFAGALAVFAALAQSPALAVSTIIVSVILHQIESHVLVPLFIGRQTGLHPVIVIVALLAGFELGGFLGILICVPAAVVLQELLEVWAAKKPNPVPAIAGS